MHRGQLRTSLKRLLVGVVALVAVALAIAYTHILYTALAAAPAAVSVPSAAKPTPPMPKVAGLNAEVEVPDGTTVEVSQDQPEVQTYTIKTRPQANTASQPAGSVTSPSSPAAPAPETFVLNLKTPVRHTLKAGTASPVLRHLLFDGAQRQWKPGFATSWRNEPPQTQEPVWAVIQVDKPTSQPYVSDTVPFIIYAAADAQPGDYAVKIKMVFREGVEVGIPVRVTVKK